MNKGVRKFRNTGTVICFSFHGYLLIFQCHRNSDTFKTPRLREQPHDVYVIHNASSRCGIQEPVHVAQERRWCSFPPDSVFSDMDCAGNPQG